MATTNCTVRHARREDVYIILALIKELADYEKELDSVVATEESLANTIAFATSDHMAYTSGKPVTEPTSPSRPARCLVLFNEAGEGVGMALYFYNYSTWGAKPGVYLEDRYVRSTEWKKGYGKRLLVERAKEVVAMDGGRLEWHLKISESIGAKAMDEWLGMRVDGDALPRLARFLD